MRLWKKVALGILGVLIVAVVVNWSFVHYGLKQLRGQLNVVFNTRPVAEVLADPTFPDSLKIKLELIQEVRAFAVDELGLVSNSNYTSMFDQKGADILWNVTASAPFKLEAYEWQFPILGKMPYKGFFNLDDAKRERDALAAKGFDTRIGAVGGWSTLGILSDPILSRMLERSEGHLAEVIIHELTHATLFVENEVTFNENLASFIGEKGAELFLMSRFGDSSEYLMKYQTELQEEKKFTQHILRGALALDSLYTTFTSNIDTLQMTERKNATILRITKSMDSITFTNPRFSRIFTRAQPNNAYFMSFIRYHSQEDTLLSVYKTHNQNIQHLIEAFKVKYGK